MKVSFKHFLKLFFAIFTFGRTFSCESNQCWSWWCRCIGFLRDLFHPETTANCRVLLFSVGLIAQLALVTSSFLLFLYWAWHYSIFSPEIWESFNEIRDHIFSAIHKTKGFLLHSQLKGFFFCSTGILPVEARNGSAVGLVDSAVKAHLCLKPQNTGPFWKLTVY